MNWISETINETFSNIISYFNYVFLTLRLGNLTDATFFPSRKSRSRKHYNREFEILPCLMKPRKDKWWYRGLYRRYMNFSNYPYRTKLRVLKLEIPANTLISSCLVYASRIVPISVAFASMRHESSLIRIILIYLYAQYIDRWYTRWMNAATFLVKNPRSCLLSFIFYRFDICPCRLTWSFRHYAKTQGLVFLLSFPRRNSL